MGFLFECEDRSPRGIAATIARGISAGELVAGERLPTVRELATQLGVSPATISAAWQALGRAGMVESRGRAGSFVTESPREWMRPRTRGLAGHGVSLRIDLSRGTPDPALLPALGPAFSRVSTHASIGSYQDVPVLPELGRLLTETWPSTAESITVVDGALDAISRTLDEILAFGDRVAVESPGFPPFYDLVEALGAESVPMELDEFGVTPRGLTQALDRRVRAIVLQPRAHNPTGASMSEDRARELANILNVHRNAVDVIVVEDDHSALIATAPEVSLGRWLPTRTVHVRSFSKSHGPDLRIAAVGGPAKIIDRVVARRMLGPGWTSRMLQTILYDLLTDEVARTAVRTARTTYAERQQRLADALRIAGCTLSQSDGINLWLPVTSERATMVRLAAEEIRVAAGEPFVAGTSVEDPEHVRVSVGAIGESLPEIAAALAGAAGQAAAAFGR